MRRHLRGPMLFLLLLLASGTLVSCAPEAEVPPSPQSRFEATVARADDAWAAGDADSAFELYSKALKIDEATDSAGTVAEKQEAAKRLVLSRRILATTQTEIGSISSFVQVLDYSSADSTEAAEARGRLADSIRTYLRPLRDDVSELKSQIKPGAAVEMPMNSFLVARTGDDWQKAAADAPGPVGEHASAAVESMLKATEHIQRAVKRRWADQAQRDLTAASAALDKVERELKSVESGK